MEYYDIGIVMGYLAGAILIYSGYPALKELIRYPRFGTLGERRSRLLMVTGNLRWVLSGLLTQNQSVLVMRAINVVIQLAIWTRMTSQRTN